MLKVPDELLSAASKLAPGDHQMKKVTSNESKDDNVQALQFSSFKGPQKSQMGKGYRTHPVKAQVPESPPEPLAFSR